MILLSLLLLLFPSSMSIDSFDQIIFWNVGQGQWITSVHKTNCSHFDVGGEFFSRSKIKETCSKKENEVFYSHWDWDHIGLTSDLKRLVSKLCIAVLPQGEGKSFKRKYLSTISLCKKPHSSIKQLKFSYRKSKSPNDLSNVFIYNKKLLIPGDSPKKMEKIWSPLIKNENLKWLSLSHHGSKTSTSKYFLKNTNRIILAIASARKEVYGHPHQIVIERLKKAGIPLLCTEDWGNIHIITHLK